LGRRDPIKKTPGLAKRGRRKGGGTGKSPAENDGKKEGKAVEENER